MDALFGVVNIPNVVWIDEAGIIVRPAEPGWPGGQHEMPRNMLTSIPKLGRAQTAPQAPEGSRGLAGIAAGRTAGPIPMRYATGSVKGSQSAFALTPEEVVARSQERSPGMSEGAAHFELANHLWRAGSVTSPSAISTNPIGCSPPIGPTSGRRGRWSATSASAATSAALHRRRSRARRGL